MPSEINLDLAMVCFVLKLSSLQHLSKELTDLNIWAGFPQERLKSDILILQAAEVHCVLMFYGMLCYNWA